MATALASLAPVAAATTCAHCGAGLADPQARFCCAGCAAARAVIDGLGLDQFYLRGRRYVVDRPLVPDAERPDLTPHVRVARDGSAALELFVDGLSCPACMWLIESVLARVQAVTR